MAMINGNEYLHLPLKVAPEPLATLIRQRQLYEAVAAAVDAGVFERLKTAKTADALSAELAIDCAATLYLLKTLEHLGCLRVEGDRFINTPLAATFLLRDSYLYLGQEFVADSAAVPPAGTLREKLRGASDQNTPEPAWSQERLRQLGVLGLMGSIQGTLGACDLSGARRLLDLGGGHGFYSIAFAQKYQEIKVTMFDLPQVVALAEHFVRMFGVERQVALIGGDFLADDIGTGFDAVLCANILHGDKREIVLPKVRRALNPGGQVILKCRVADSADNLENSLTKFRWRVYGGREIFSTDEWRSLLARHGFRDIRTVGFAGIYATMVGSC